MNIGTFLATPSQSVTSDGQGIAEIKGDTSSTFGQVLANLTVNAQINQTQTLPNIPPGVALPTALLKILSQNSGQSDSALDLLQGAPITDNNQQETLVTLTEIMAALQPVVNESEVESPVLFPLEDEADQGSDADTGDEAQLAALALIVAGFAPNQPISVVPQMPSPESTSSASDVADEISTWTQSTVQGTTEDNRLDSSLRDTNGRMTATANHSETIALSAGTTPNSSAIEHKASFAQTLTDQTTQALVTSETENSLATPVTANETKPLPKANVLNEGLNPVVQTESLKVQSSTFNVQIATPETPAPLPDVPALHQIVEKVSLITRQGETEVRLHLQPESLGQVLIQLHIADGDVSVRMLTQTAQAHNLIQEHLSQLKAAFTAQGLQMNNLTVAIGNDASAFDMHNRQSNDWSQGSAQQQTSSGHVEIDTAASARPIPGSWNGLHIVDYQA